MSTTQRLGGRHPSQIDTCPTVDQLLRDRRRRLTPGGRSLTARRVGRLFVTLDMDNWPTEDWPADITAVMAPMAEQLATLYVHRRNGPAFISGWTSTAHLYAPMRAADVLLRVMWAVDGGDLTPAHTVAPIIADACHTLEQVRTRSARSACARTVVTQLEDDLNATLTNRSTT